jgi:hypothetical protein
MPARRAQTLVINLALFFLVLLAIISTIWATLTVIGKLRAISLKTNIVEESIIDLARVGQWEAVLSAWI